MINRIIISSILVFVISCVNSKSTQTNDSIKLSPVNIVDDVSIYTRNNSETTILKASIEGSILVLNISFNGGCEIHDFELIGSEVLLKSNPPVREVKLIHNANNDDCRELVKKELKFDVSKFKSEKAVMLKIEGWIPKIELK